MRSRIFIFLALLLLVLPVAAQEEITLTPFSNDTLAISGVVPDGWVNLAPGVYRRGTDATDITLIAQQAAPASADQVMTSLLPQLNLTEAPEAVDTLTTDALEWTLYKVDVEAQGISVAVDMGIAEADGKSYVILLQTSPDEYDTLHEQVFLPAVNALAPLSAEATTEATAEDLPYTAEDVTFENGDVTLAGTLTLPEGEGPYPAIVLISGSGPQDRDESLEPVASIKPFRLIADYLTQEGIAVLRYDDRGVARSTGDFSAATSADFATDAEAAVNYLAGRDDINSDQIGILGHSEGGAIAPVVANNADVAFIVSLSGSVVNGRDVLIEQNRRIYQSMGYDEATIDDLIAKLEVMLDAFSADPLDEDAARQAMLDLAVAQLEALPEENKAGIDDIEATAAALTDQQMGTYTSPWFQYFLTFDPTEAWAQVDVPVLAFFGELDTQVDADQNIPALEQALAGNENLTIKVFPTANHLYQDAVTGSPNEYASLEQAFVPDLLPTIADWILEQVSTQQ
ncbi:MAG: alpha/beta fold hydrolase [Anaerolineae bacterium]|nr:alpha/beta fold hydrolase [Anaerolineae bacterium]